MKPSASGLYLLQNSAAHGRLPSVDRPALLDNDAAFGCFVRFCPLAQTIWTLNMQSFHAQHDNGVPTLHVMPSSVKNVSCDSCFFDKAIAIPRNTLACAKPPHPLMNMSSEIWGTVNMPFPHGLRYCVLVIDHHTNFRWVRFLESKDDTCSELDEPILLEVRYLHARFQYASSAIAAVLKFDSYSVFEAKATRHICGRLGVGVQFSPPYAHHMLGKAERPWRPECLHR
jgi:hypothetical protein